MSPTGSASDQMIPMVEGGECSGGDFGGNWITVRARPDDNATSGEGNYFGFFSYTGSNATATLSSGFALADGFAAQEAASMGTGYCRNGVVLTENSDIYVSTGATAGQPFTVDLFGSTNEPAHGFVTG